MQTHGGATQAHMDAYVVPTWREEWYRTDGIKSRNRTVGIKSRNQIVGIKSRDWTARITRSGIRVMGHDPTNYARSDSWNYTEWNPRHEPPISRDPTAEITRSEILVVGHDPSISHKLLYK